ncbi:MAG: DNA-binding protein [Hyphomicrobium sp.]|nr:DNA-binding protein [Hyphomicrobium sp.]
MTQDLTTSSVQRQNILNNPFALAEIEKAIGIRGIEFEGKKVVLLDQVAFFFRVDRRTIERIVNANKDELTKNGYAVVRGNELILLKKAISDNHGTDINVGTIARASVLSVFDFKALINIAMLLSESDRARTLRKAMLDIVMDVINVRAGGGTKYVNQRDEEFIERAFAGEGYRKEFTTALDKFVEMGKSKYPIYTDKIYQAIFLENARTYRRIIKLEQGDSTRDSFYAEILSLVFSFECGIAKELEAESTKAGRKLDPWEVDQLIEDFASRSHWPPLMEHARRKMASRDLALRGVTHSPLEGYILPLPREEFERFLGNKSKELTKRLEEAKDVMKRLKNR